MKNAKTIGLIGQILMIIGSAAYLLDLLTSYSTAQAWMGTEKMVVILSCVYIVALVLMFIGWIGTRDERKAAKAAEKK